MLSDSDCALADHDTIETLRLEASDVFNAGRDILAGADRVVSIGLIAVGAFLSYALDGHHYEAWMIIPIALSFLLSFQLQAFADSSALNQYREQLESELNDVMGMDRYAWARSFAPTRSGRNNPSLAVAFIVLVLSIVTTASYAGFLDIHNHYGILITIGYFTSLVLSAAMIGFSGLELLRSGSKHLNAPTTPDAQGYRGPRPFRGLWSGARDLWD